MRGNNSTSVNRGPSGGPPSALAQFFSSLIIICAWLKNNLENAQFNKENNNKLRRLIIVVENKAMYKKDLGVIERGTPPSLQGLILI